MNKHRHLVYTHTHECTPALLHYRLIYNLHKCDLWDTTVCKLLQTEPSPCPVVCSGQIDGQEITAGAVHMPRPPVRPPPRRSPPRRPPPRWRNSPPRFGGRRWAAAIWTVILCDLVLFIVEVVFVYSVAFYPKGPIFFSSKYKHHPIQVKSNLFCSQYQSHQQQIKLKQYLALCNAVTLLLLVWFNILHLLKTPPLKGSKMKISSWLENIQKLCKYFHLQGSLVCYISIFMEQILFELLRPQLCWPAVYQWGAEKGWFLIRLMFLPYIQVSSMMSLMQTAEHKMVAHMIRLSQFSNISF